MPEIHDEDTVVRSKRMKVPRCEASTKKTWYRPNGGRCPYEAVIVLDGQHLCNLHANLCVKGEEAEADSGLRKCKECDGGGQLFPDVGEGARNCHVCGGSGWVPNTGVRSKEGGDA